jgi:hypothetical protein
MGSLSPTRSRSKGWCAKGSEELQGLADLNGGPFSSRFLRKDRRSARSSAGKRRAVHTFSHQYLELIQTEELLHDGLFALLHF